MPTSSEEPLRPPLAASSPMMGAFLKGCVYLKEDKVSRVLALYSQLLGGRTIQKAAAAQQYGVNERSIQRDIEDIRAFCRNGMALGDGT